MRRFIFYLATLEGWERYGRIVKAKAHTLKGAFKKIKRKIKKDESVYEVMTRREGCSLFQPCWDYFSGARIYDNRF